MATKLYHKKLLVIVATRVATKPWDIVAIKVATEDVRNPFCNVTYMPFATSIVATNVFY